LRGSSGALKLPEKEFRDGLLDFKQHTQLHSSASDPIRLLRNGRRLSK
jgi:hypothetical protein